MSQIVAQLPIDRQPRPLDEQVEVVGETYYTRQIKSVFREFDTSISPKGTTLKDLECLLVPDPWNEYDSNAVAVVIGTHHVGHLPAELAADYAHPLGEIARHGRLVPGQARIWAKSDEGIVRARVTIVIPAVEDL